jgi:hypothetical protein
MLHGNFIENSFADIHSLYRPWITCLMMIVFYWNILFNWYFKITRAASYRIFLAQ